ncbi:MAG TPA: prolyl oligopeptidase family serine peptidase, partial [Streptosporangiaceae bacterium]|nr:prolyl oligopeptidase family serine peptidase [Streptosporangiaceae bacterium]
MRMTTETTPYGEWASPIAGADVARKQVGLAFAVIDGAGVWWQESRPEEGGRVAVVCQGPDGVNRDLLPMPYNARTRVHEYGGRSYQPIPGGFVFANFNDQRLYRCGAEGDPQPLTPEPGDVSFRFADFVLSPGGNEIWCVRERHEGGRITRAIAAVPLDGSAARDDGAMRLLVSGSDFYAFPAPSPDGTRLAFICWDHPLMPWDGTELRVAAVDGDGTQQVIMGGPAVSVLAPAWRDDQSLYVISDRSGWWNLYLTGLDGTGRHLCPRPEEFAAPLWQLGASPYAVLGDGRLAVTYGTGEARLGVLDPDSGRLGQLGDLDLPYRAYVFGLTASGQAIATIAGGPTVPTTVISVDVPVAGNPASVVARELSRSTDALPDPAYLPVPRAAELTGPSGSVVHALVYPPSNPAMRAPEGERPPYIVWVHGGPTAQSVARLDLEKAFFTSRGIGIIDVNYGGSTGYGRAYRERLRGQWGVVDVADAMTAALALAGSGEADGKRLGIRGGSAGGWTALAAVTSGVGVLGGGNGSPGGNGTRERVFAAVASYFGVADLRAFAEHTHDFESRYLDGLIGPLPESEPLYAERAPVGHVNDATCPVLLLQGLDDPVVPPAQAESIAADLSAHGIPYAYITFAGESHGFRKAENIVASMEAELSFYGQIMGFVPPGIPP